MWRRTDAQQLRTRCRRSSWLLCAAASFCTVFATGAGATADPDKVIRVAFEGADEAFDLAKTFNPYSYSICLAIFETLLTYDYLARPAKLVPLTAETLPAVSDGGRTYEFHLRKGIYFANDVAFKGTRRELVAQDYAYAIKRVLDPTNRAPTAGLITGRIVGMDGLVARAKKTGHFDYDAPVAGIETPDRYTLRVRLTKPDFNFSYVMACPPFGAVAREVIEAYGQQSGIHPVGSGPYMLKEYRPRSRIVLEANPDYRGFVWDFAPTGDARDDQLVRDMTGKPMPQVGRVEISIIEEAQSRWLAFQSGQFAYLLLPSSFAPAALDGDRLKADLDRQGVGVYRVADPETLFTLFNMRDKVVGGYSLEKNALRRAIAMSYNIDEEISLVSHNQAIKAEMVVPQGVVGYDPAYRNSIPYDQDLANRLLDHFGYKRGEDGFRTLPDGKPVVIKLQPLGTVGATEELWKRSLDAIGLRTDVVVGNYADQMKAGENCMYSMWNFGWSSDYPEAESFLAMLYGPNVGQANYACYESKQLDDLFEKFVATPAGTQRDTLVREMNRQAEADTVWVMRTMPIETWMIRSWVRGFKWNPYLVFGMWQYLDVDKH